MPVRMTRESGNEASDSTLEGAKVLHELIGAYRQLAYRVLLSHVGLGVAAAYFMLDKGQVINDLSRTHRISIAAILAIVGSLVFWWLRILQMRSDEHVDRAWQLWDALQVKPNPVKKKSELGHFMKRMWFPIQVTPWVTTACLLLLLLPQGAASASSLRSPGSSASPGIDGQISVVMIGLILAGVSAVGTIVYAAVAVWLAWLDHRGLQLVEAKGAPIRLGGPGAPLLFPIEITIFNPAMRPNHRGAIIVAVEPTTLGIRGIQYGTMLPEVIPALEHASGEVSVSVPVSPDVGVRGTYVSVDSIRVTFVPARRWFRRRMRRTIPRALFQYPTCSE